MSEPIKVEDYEFLRCEYERIYAYAKRRRRCFLRSFDEWIECLVLAHNGRGFSLVEGKEKAVESLQTVNVNVQKAKDGFRKQVRSLDESKGGYTNVSKLY